MFKNARIIWKTFIDQVSKMNNHADTHLLMPTAYPDCGLDIHNIYTLNKLNATPGCMCMLYIRHISLDILDVPDILDAFDKGSPFLKFVVSIWALPVRAGGCKGLPRWLGALLSTFVH